MVLKCDEIHQMQWQKNYRFFRCFPECWPDILCLKKIYLIYPVAKGGRDFRTSAASQCFIHWHHCMRPSPFETLPTICQDRCSALLFVPTSVRWVAKETILTMRRLGDDNLILPPTAWMIITHFSESSLLHIWRYQWHAQIHCESFSFWES